MVTSRWIDILNFHEVIYKILNIPPSGAISLVFNINIWKKTKTELFVQLLIMFSWRDNALVIAHMTHNLMLLVLMNKNHPNKAGVPKLKSGVKSLVLLWGLPTTPDNIFWVICHNLIFLFGLLAFHCHFTLHFHRILRDFLILFKKSVFL